LSYHIAKLQNNLVFATFPNINSAENFLHSFVFFLHSLFSYCTHFGLDVLLHHQNDKIKNVTFDVTKREVFTVIFGRVSMIFTVIFGKILAIFTVIFGKIKKISYLCTFKILKL